MLGMPMPAALNLLSVPEAVSAALLHRKAIWAPC